jgi:hypothetical protein
MALFGQIAKQFALLSAAGGQVEFAGGKLLLVSALTE